MSLNYISEKLVKSAMNVYNMLDTNYQKELNTIVENILNLFDGYFDHINNDKTIIYKLINTITIKLNDMDGIDTSNTILNKLNRMREYELIFNMMKIKITIYCNKTDDENILDQNIYKIMTRLINLFTLYEKKNNDMYNLLKYEYIFYLYENPRTSNRNKSGEKYMESLYDSKNRCFNASSGVTMLSTMTVKVSRTEDFLGLLTHEILHACGIININTPVVIHGITIKMTEAFVNMLAAIVNVYLTCYENNMIGKIKDYILVELIHSINHMVKYSIIQGYSVNMILDMKQNIMLTQNACLFEYIVGKMILFINLDKMCKIKDFKQKLFSLTIPWEDSSLDNIVIDKFKSLYKNSNLIDKISAIHTKFLNKNEESTTICGNMLMSYYAIDMMVLNKMVNNLYGGGMKPSTFYKNKYIKYKNKYALLKERIYKYS